VGIKEDIQKLVSSGSARHKRLIDYTVRQLNGGRSLNEIIEDPYLTNRLNVVERRALLEEPKIVEAAGDEVLAEMRERLESIAGG
jgi:hypothetical protein